MLTAAAVYTTAVITASDATSMIMMIMMMMMMCVTCHMTPSQHTQHCDISVPLIQVFNNTVT